MSEDTDRTTALDDEAHAVLEFWLGPSDGEEWGKLRKLWFGGGSQVDDEIRSRFGALHVRGCAGALADWEQSAHGSLALIILLDQFSRNLHRGTPAAFAADPMAREIASRAIDRDFDQQVLPVQRWFFYLPFEHAESLADQRRALTLFESLPAEPSRDIGVDYARKHLEVIEKFGRFPHRNETLGRPSTPEETRWLAEGGARFG